MIARENNPFSGRNRLRDFLTDLVIRLFLFVARLVPYERRVWLGGRAMAHLVVPLTDIRQRVTTNLELVFPDMPEHVRRRIFQGCVDNFGRILVEAYSTAQFVERVARSEPSGPGLEEIERAVAQGRPVILVTAHFGNYEAGRIMLIRRGLVVGGLYRPMNNPFFNRHYVRTMELVGQPVFPRGGAGTKGLVKFIRQGGIAVILNDQYSSEGDELSFMGLSAMTSTAVARLAVRHKALLVPFYGVRQGNGLDFAVEFERPVEHGDVAVMTQLLNRSLEARVHAHPEQWYWIHRRWKGLERTPPDHVD